MASAFENLFNDVMDVTNDVINVGIGAAAVAAEKSKEVIDDLNAKGQEVRSDPSTSDFARSLVEAFERAGGTISETVERLSMKGASLSDKILDEFILNRARQLSVAERAEFVAHVKDLVDSIEDETVTVEAEAVEEEPAEDGAEPAEDGAAPTEPAEDGAADA